MGIKPTSISHAPTKWFLALGWAALVVAAYGRLILHPDLHTACPENDTWNLPIRFSVLSSLCDGKIPLWNSRPAFGMPWLATWQTECFYPGTLLFAWLGLSAWNLSGLLHLCILSIGIFSFLRANNVSSFWSFFAAAIALINGCAYNHLGSNSSMDTMAWIPWMFLATHQVVGRKPWGGFKWALFFVLQVFAGYPQIIFYTLVGCFSYAAILKGSAGPIRLLPPLLAGLLISTAQWMPSIEYFFIDSVRLPAVHDNPHFFLPLENLKTFLDFNALGKGGIPDYVQNPTFFYFNFYSGFLPLVVLILGAVRFDKLKSNARFFLIGFLLFLFWSLGFVLQGLDHLHLPYPAFLEPAKCWVLINVFELFAVGLILGDVFPNPPKWKWAVLVLGGLNLLWPLWNHPVEQNLLPPGLESSAEAKKVLTSLGPGRLLILPNTGEHQKLYTPLPDPENRPYFKHFVPNSNLFANLPSATFYGSTQPTWGALDAGFYFRYGFPYRIGSLIDMLGVDFLYLPENDMPPRFKKVETDDSWTLWKNPGSVGPYYFFPGGPKSSSRKEIFTSFADGNADPKRDLFLDPNPVSSPPSHKLTRVGVFKDGFLGFFSMKDSDRYLVITQNAMPGWRAWVNYKPSPIYIANGIFLCVPIPQETGKVHQIIMAYEPTSFRFGLFLSLLAITGFLGWGGLRSSGGFGLPNFFARPK